jgi:hypothetical protein
MRLNAAQVHHVHGLAHDGRLTPDDVLADAQSAASPLHALFDWDLERSAQRDWLRTARLIIGAVKTETIVTHFEVEVPAYLRDRNQPARHQGYVSVTRLQQDPIAAAETMEYEIGRAKAGILRVRAVALALGLESAVDDLLAHLARVQASVPMPDARGSASAAEAH